MKKFLFYLLVFSVLIFIPLKAEARVGTVRFVQATDIHYVSGDEDMKNVLKTFVKSVNRIKGLDFVIFTGDNINSPDIATLKEFLKTVRGIKAPVYYIIGNHDVSKNSGLDKDKYLEVLRANNIFHPIWKPNYKFNKKGYVFIIADGAKQIIPGPGGYYKKDTLDWVDKQLTKNKHKNVVIIQHFPIISPRKSRTHQTYKADNYLEMLDKHKNVIAVISGHFHINKEEMRNGVYHVSTPAMMLEPHYYKLIEIKQNGKYAPVVFTQLREFDI